jgi:hypothetical protein
LTATLTADFAQLAIPEIDWIHFLKMNLVFEKGRNTCLRAVDYGKIEGRIYPFLLLIGF